MLLVGDKVSVWYGSVIRGDEASVTVGDNTSVGDRAVVSGAVSIGSHVSIGAGAVLRNCVVKSEAVVGAGREDSMADTQPDSVRFGAEMDVPVLVSDPEGETNRDKDRTWPLRANNTLRVRLRSSDDDVIGEVVTRSDSEHT